MTSLFFRVLGKALGKKPTLKVVIKQGKSGKWRWSVYDKDNRCLGVENVNMGHDDPRAARNAAEALFDSGWDMQLQFVPNEQ